VAENGGAMGAALAAREGAGSPGSPRGMGRGLAAILSGGPQRVEGLREIAVELIDPNPRQPREVFDDEALVALGESIRARGVLQPIVVRALPGGRYELVAGERRLRASKLAELERIPALVREAEEGERLELALMENVAREDLNPVEEARACATLVKDLGITREDLGRRIGRSRVAVSNLIRLLDLPDEALSLVASGALSEGHGRAILMRRDHAGRRALAREAQANGWSVRETEQRARSSEPAAEGDRPAAGTAVHPDLAEALGTAEDALSAALGRQVRVRARKGGARVQFDLADPHEGVELAEQLLRKGRSRPTPRR
jgi:ParB family transcriptional regulator, chromosome partitioning protein